MKKKLISYIAFIFLLSLLCSCSRSSSLNENSALKRTLVNVSADYLNAIIRGDNRRVKSKMFLSSFISSKKQPFKSKDLDRQLSSLNSRWNKNNHPLVNLDVIKVEKNQDDAYLEFRRIKSENSPLISIKLLWAGSGWLVVEDNLFGPEGLFGSLPTISQEQRSRPGIIKHLQTSK